MTANSTVSSNAFNYLDFVKSSVDARTGQYTLSLALPELQANALSGPNVPLSLDYNPLNPDDSGYGIGWNLRLSQYIPHTSMLTLHSGESFKATSSHDDNELHFAEQKINNFRFFKDGTDTWRIVHKSGLVEILRAGGSQEQRVALPVTIYAASGHSISLEYEGFRGGQRLSRISDAQGDLLQILRSTSEVRLLLPPFDDQPLTRFLMKLTSDRVMEIVLPVPEQASWRFDYALIRGLTCIKQVRTPLGAYESLDYLDEGHPYPGSSGRPNLPRVTHYQVQTGPNGPVMKTQYEYSDRNFLGFGAPIQWEGDGYDQLYKVNSSYEYYTIIKHLLDDKVARTVKRTYNRFHLQTEEKVTRGNCIKSTVVEYHDEDRPFSEQPPNFQLPKTTETRWELSDDQTQVRSEIEYSEFDLEGNLVLETRRDGISTRMSYYDPDGEDGCPADPGGFVRNLKETIVTPAAGAEGDAPTLITRYRYSAHAPLAGAPLSAWLTMSDEFLYEVRGDKEVLLNHTHRDYHETPADPLRHGRPLQQTDSLNGTQNTLDFTYTIVRDALLDEDSLLRNEHFTGFDGLTRTVSRHDSLLHGQPLIVFDDNDVQVLYRYDSLRRPVGETVAPGTSHAATRSYTQQLVASDGQRASEIVTDVKGVQVRTWFDGQGRSVISESNSGAGWQELSSATYDGLGQLREETRHDWLGTRKLSLTTGYEYDDWGQVCRTTLPDGVALLSERSPFGKGGDLLKSWKESSDDKPLASEVNLVQYNRLDKVEWSERRDDQDKVVGREAFIYNGHGECIRSDVVTALETRSTHFEYDERRRVVRTRLPGNAVVERSFAGHSRNELPTAIRVIPGNIELPEVLLGEQTFDSLERLASLTVGPRVESYEYEGQMKRVHKRTTPASKTIEYVYEANLGDLPKEIIAPEGTSTFQFDQQDAGVSGTGNAAGNREYLYNANGHLRLERWIDVGGSNHETTYETSLLGLPTKRTEDGVVTEYVYDDLGRLEQLTQARLQADFEYDSSGRQHRTTTRDLDSGDSLVSENHYDCLGRIHQRTLQLNDSPLRTIDHVWRDDDQLLSRHYHMDGRTLLLEGFAYDMRGRLDQHDCSGERLPSDRHGHAIVQQMFRFDDLDNITQCLTTFASGDSNRARYTYADNDSCQLVKIENSWLEGGYPQTQTFDYDADGNQLNDEQGQRLHYDSQGRLLEVTSADGNSILTRYRYDGHQHLVGVQQGDEAQTLRFYQGYRISYTVRDGVRVHCFSDGQRALGQQQIGDHQRTLLLLTDASPSVIAESLAAGLREAAYSAYGEQQDEQRLESLMGFNGELREPGSGWYLLGRGYRAYNPVLMRFHSPDNLSPFLEGGLNPYMYGLGNPVRFSDPSGHRSRSTDEDIDYIEPIPQPKRKKSWLDWVAVGTMAFFAVMGALAVPWTGGASAALVVGAIGTIVSVVGVGAAVVATLTEDEELMAIANLMTIGGSLLSGSAKAIGAVFSKIYNSTFVQAVRGQMVNMAKNSRNFISTLFKGGSPKTTPGQLRLSGPSSPIVPSSGVLRSPQLSSTASPGSQRASSNSAVADSGSSSRSSPSSGSSTPANPGSTNSLNSLDDAPSLAVQQRSSPVASPAQPRITRPGNLDHNANDGLPNFRNAAFGLSVFSPKSYPESRFSNM